MTILLGVLVASFLGSLHCVGMCGPLVGAYVTGEDRGPVWRRHLAYQLGRLGTLLVLGALAGAVGTGLETLGERAGLQRGVAGITGGLMIAAGVFALLRGRGWKLPLPAVFGRLVAKVSGSQPAAPRWTGSLALGAVTPLLPCGWLWVYLLAAAGAGSPLAGAAVMGAFGLGNVPALLGAGLTWHTLIRPLRQRVPALTGSLLIALGLVVLWERSAPPPAAADGGAASAAACCHGDP